MKSQRPGILSVRAVNQYRRRDVLSYLSLRYYLDNVSARTDLWANQVATKLVLGRTDHPYLSVYHFKETDGDGTPNHREIFLPGGNEALAEAALLAACATNQEVFENPGSVFSYKLNTGDNRKGVFVPYFHGLMDRHRKIALACDEDPDCVVRYTDIKKFYPSITSDLAKCVWRKYADRAQLSAVMRDVGDRLLEDHANVGAGRGKGVLTGPMFSHLIGNLVLRDLDEYCGESLGVQYFRYVDDMTLVGPPERVAKSAKEIRSRLGDMGLDLHDDGSDKTLEISGEEWLTARNDFSDTRTSISWPSFVGDLKKFLLLNPEGREELKRVFNDQGFRVPMFDYGNAILESGYLERVAYLAKRSWYRRKSQSISIYTLVKQASVLRDRYHKEFMGLTGEARLANQFQKKRRIPKLRYRAGRMAYLATDDALLESVELSKDIPDLHFHAYVMKAIATGNVDDVLSLGANAAQAVAQPIRASGKETYSSKKDLSGVDLQSLAVLRLNGVVINRPDVAHPIDTDLMKFAEKGGSLEMMKNSEPFIREIVCLHGLSEQGRHPEVLETVFDRDEELALDAIDQLQQSVSP